MPIWPLATILYVQLNSDLTAKCLNIDCEICSQFVFESPKKFWKGEERLMDLNIDTSSAEVVVSLQRAILLIKNMKCEEF